MITADCVLYIDGERVADGSPDDDPTAPNALDGLTHIWGRQTTIDQPDAATATIDLIERDNRSSFVSLYRVGQTVEVLSTATVYSDPNRPILTDGGFEAAAIGTAPPFIVTGGSLRVTGRYPHTGAHSAQLRPDDAAIPVVVTIPPAAPSINPAAWDEVPKQSRGEPYAVGGYILALPGAVAEVRAVRWQSPEATAYTPATSWTPVALDAVLWSEFALTVPPPTDRNGAGWVGVQIRYSAAAITWGVQSGTWASRAGSWFDVGAIAYLDDVTITAPSASTRPAVSVFTGSITDMSSTADDDGALVTIAAADIARDLANTDIGDEPWPAEPAAARLARIAKLAGVDIAVPPSIAATPLSYLDVDNRPSMDLIRDVATSAGAVCWPATHVTFGRVGRLVLEDTADRAAGSTLDELPDGLVHIVPIANPDAVPISACAIDRDPVTWTQDVADLATRVAVSWREQTLDDKGKPAPTDRTVRVLDRALDDRYGAHRIRLATELATEPAARALADRTLARLRSIDWRVSGLSWYLPDDPGEDPRAALRLLDGYRRLGAPIDLYDLPKGSPARAARITLFVEGGTYVFTGGAWRLDLIVSSSHGQGRANASWGSTAAPRWRWADIAPAVAWFDLLGVTYPPPRAKDKINAR